jgi:hypothetical protein
VSPYPSQSPEAMRAYNRAYYLANRERIKAATRAYAVENREQQNAIKARSRRKPENRAREAARRRERERTDVQFALACRLRRRLHAALAGKKITANALELIGCSRAELVVHVEKQFLPGMSWENRSEWELDHKHPLSRFDLSDPAQRARACHYTNLQPLWRSNNRRKGAKCL